MHLDSQANKADHDDLGGDGMSIAAMTEGTFERNLELVEDLVAFSKGTGQVPSLPPEYFGGGESSSSEQLQHAVDAWLSSFNDSINLLREFRGFEQAHGRMANNSERDEVTEASEILLRALARRLKAQLADH